MSAGPILSYAALAPRRAWGAVSGATGAHSGIGDGGPVGWAPGMGAYARLTAGVTHVVERSDEPAVAACGRPSRVGGGLDGGEQYYLEGCGCGGECSNDEAPAVAGGVDGEARTAALPVPPSEPVLPWMGPHIYPPLIYDNATGCGCAQEDAKFQERLHEARRACFVDQKGISDKVVCVRDAKLDCNCDYECHHRDGRVTGGSLGNYDCPLLLDGFGTNVSGCVSTAFMEEWAESGTLRGEAWCAPTGGWKTGGPSSGRSAR